MCVNILNTDPEQLEFAGIQFYRYATAKPRDFKEQTHELFYYNADRLKAMRRKEREFAEKAFGIVHAPQSVIYDNYLRTIYSVPEQTYLDPMHILLASSGIAQWSLKIALCEWLASHNACIGSLSDYLSDYRVAWHMANFW